MLSSWELDYEGPLQCWGDLRKVKVRLYFEDIQQLKSFQTSIPHALEILEAILAGKFPLPFFHGLCPGFLEQVAREEGVEKAKSMLLKRMTERKEAGKIISWDVYEELESPEDFQKLEVVFIFANSDQLHQFLQLHQDENWHELPEEDQSLDDDELSYGAELPEFID